jgi:carbamoylphosphate synthase large subunit
VTRKTVVVAYDDGAAHPADIAVGLAEWARCVFVAEPNEHTRMMEPLLAQFGPVLMAESADRVIREARAHRPDGLVTYSEKALGLASWLAAALDLPFHDRQAYELLTDKWAQRDALRVAGVDAVQCHRIVRSSDWPDAVAATGLPAVLKPTNGGASRNTFLITDAAAGFDLVVELLATGRPGLVVGGTLVLEEYIPGRDCSPFGDYVSVESVVCDGNVTDLAVTGKFPMVPPFRETGYFWPAPIADGEETQVRELARRAVGALGVRSGVTHTEIKLTPMGPRIIEVNGRLGGHINELSIRATGVNLVEMAARVAIDDPIAAPRFYQGPPHFQIFHPAPRRPCSLLGIDGIDEVKNVPGVSLYRPYARSGTCLPGGVETRQLDIVMGEAADFADLAAIAENIGSILRYRFSFADGDRLVSAADLGKL